MPSQFRWALLRVEAGDRVGPTTEVRRLDPTRSSPAYDSAAIDAGKVMTAHLDARIGPLADGIEGVRLQLVGEIDIATVEQFRTALEELLGTHHEKVVIDATGIDFMDSTGLHALMDGKRLIHETGSTVVLVASPAVRRILELIFPDPLFAARVDTVEEALAVLEREQR